jgi:predicted nucleic acid-binding protein
VIYLDTSALIKLYIREAGSEDVQAWVASQDDPLPVWELQEMELMNALYLKVFWKEIALQDAEKQIELFRERQRQGFYVCPDFERLSWIDEFRRICRETAGIGSRTLDIQHVACALLLKPNSFISYDERQRNLAAKLGLNVLPEDL